MAHVEARAAALGLDRNAGVEMALEAFVQDDDGLSVTILQLRNQVAELKTQRAETAARAVATRRGVTRLHTQTEQKTAPLTMSDDDKRTEPVAVPLSPVKYP